MTGEALTELEYFDGAAAFFGIVKPLGSSGKFARLSGLADNVDSFEDVASGLRKAEDFMPSVGRGVLETAGAPRELVSGSIRLGDSSDTFVRFISRRSDVDPDGMLDVVLHGASDRVLVGSSHLVDHRVLGNLIAKDSQYSGQPIRLLPCNTGSAPSRLAQNLSNKLGVDVLAPNNFIWARPDGSHLIAGRKSIGSGASRRLIPDMTDPGDWAPYSPGPQLQLPLGIGR